MDSTDTPQILAGCLAGDERAIERLVAEYQAGVFRLALSVLDDPLEANEAAQDTFIAALKALENYHEQATFRAWLYTIALNISRSRLRKRKTLQRLSNTLQGLFRIQAQKTPSTEEAVIQNEQEAALWRALETLGEKHRLPIVLRYFHDLSTAEIAAILQINEGTVFSRLHNARERLRVELETQPGFTGD